MLLDGDQAVFLPTFGTAVVMVRPGRLSASGPATALRKKIGVAGDEASVSVPACAYVSGAFTVPGMGTLSISRLGADQTARSTTSGGKAVLLKGSQFTARFSVEAPALMPPPASTPDPVPFYEGSGSFLTTNLEAKAT